MKLLCRLYRVIILQSGRVRIWLSIFVTRHASPYVACGIVKCLVTLQRGPLLSLESPCIDSRHWSQLRESFVCQIWLESKRGDPVYSDHNYCQKRNLFLMTTMFFGIYNEQIIIICKIISSSRPPVHIEYITVYCLLLTLYLLTVQYQWYINIILLLLNAIFHHRMYIRVGLLCLNLPMVKVKQVMYKPFEQDC